MTMPSTPHLYMGKEEAMKRFALILLLAALPLVGLSGESFVSVGPRTVSYTDRVTGGSLVVTQSVEQLAFELVRVDFTVPTAGITNTFSVAHVRTYALPDTHVSNVTTSDVIDMATGSAVVETNTQHILQGAASVTNTWTATATTNDTTWQVYDIDDFDRGWIFEYEDITTYSFSDTNAINMTRTYKTYLRP